MLVGLSPAGLATTALTANQLSVTATYKEKLCKSVCRCAFAINNLPITITYSYGTPVLSGTTVFVPITANIVVNDGSCKPPQFTETFDVSFQGQTGLPTSANSVTITSVGRISHAKGNCLTISDSLTIALTAAAA